MLLSTANTSASQKSRKSPKLDTNREKLKCLRVEQNCWITVSKNSSLDISTCM